MSGGMVKTVTLAGYPVPLRCSPAELPQQLFILKNGKNEGLQIQI